MSILVTTCITSSTGDSAERSLKVGISVGDVTFGDIGRSFWPHVYSIMTCSAVQMYDEEVDGYVDVLNADKVIVEPGNKIRFKFVQSMDISVINPPASYAVRSTVEGTIVVIGHSAILKNGSLLGNHGSTRTKVPDVVRLPVNTVAVRDLQNHPDILNFPVSSPESDSGVLTAQKSLSTVVNGQFTHSTSDGTPQKAPTVVNSQIERPETRKRRPSIRWTSPTPSNRNSFHEGVITVESDPGTLPAENSSIRGNQVIGDAENQTEKPECRKRRQKNASASPAPKISPAELTKGRNYATVRIDQSIFLIRSYASNRKMDPEALLRRISTCNATLDSHLIKILSTVMSNWLNTKAPGHSLNFRRAMVQNFLSELFLTQSCDIQVFTNMDCSGTVDKLIVRKPPNSKHEEVLRMLDNHWKCERPAEQMDESHHASSTSYRDGLINRVKNGQLDIDELFDQYPYLLSRIDLLDNEFQRVCKTSLRVVGFEHLWKIMFSSWITKSYAAKKLVFPNGIFPDRMPTNIPLIEFVKLYALTKIPDLPVTVLQDLIIFIEESDEEIVHQIRTERAIAHPVILADKNGYRLFVGNRTIFNRYTLFLQVLAQLIIVSYLLHIPPVARFHALFHVLNKMYGLEQLFPSRHGDVVFRALESQR